ncbi:MAG TPA: hypothetical protein VLX29_01785 [Nitrospirota bacterium]|nr:hypothetical protein [Nitrospirota bacterium]
MLKKLLPYIVAVIVTIGIFIGGFYFGIHTFASMKNTTMLQDHFINSTQAMSALNYFDEGKNEQARQFLLLNLDASILGINALAEQADKQSYETACNILAGIAKHRKDNPTKYSSYTYSLENLHSPDIRKEVGRVLLNWEACKKQK